MKILIMLATNCSDRVVEFTKYNSQLVLFRYEALNIASVNGASDTTQKRIHF